MELENMIVQDVTADTVELKEALETLDLSEDELAELNEIAEDPELKDEAESGSQGGEETEDSLLAKGDVVGCSCSSSCGSNYSRSNCICSSSCGSNFSKE